MPTKSKNQMIVNFEASANAASEVVPPIFRLGEDEFNQEVLIDGKRILFWKLTGNENQVARLAGWDVFPQLIDGDKGSLQLPEGTSNAQSVLSGMEAWTGEKRAVVERVSKYLEDVQAHFGFPGVGFAWNQVGVTPDQHIFIAPPNTLIPASHEQTQNWRETISVELGLLLQNDDQNRNLAEQFLNRLNGIDGDDN